MKFEFLINTEIAQIKRNGLDHQSQQFILLINVKSPGENIDTRQLDNASKKSCWQVRHLACSSVVMAGGCDFHVVSLTNDFHMKNMLKIKNKGMSLGSHK